MSVVDTLFPPGTEVKARYPDKFKGKVTDAKPSNKHQYGKIPVDSGRQVKWFFPSQLRLADEVSFISRDKSWKVGDRAFSKSLGEVRILDQRDGLIQIQTVDNCNPWLSRQASTELEELEPLKVDDRVYYLGHEPATIIELEDGQAAIQFSDCELPLWAGEENLWLYPISKPVDSLKDKEDSPEALNKLSDSTGESQSSKAQALVRFCDRNSSTQSGKETSEDFTQDQANMIYSLADSPAPIPAEPGTEPESVTPIQNLAQCSESSSDASVKPNQNSSFWSNLPDLNIEDLERGLEDCEWADIKASIQSSRALINLERNLRGSDCLSFPTLLSGQGRKHRDAGQTKCESWFKKSGTIPVGSQLSASAIAMLHGFPADWYKAISPLLFTATTDTQEDLQPENLEVKPSQSPKQELPLNGLNGCGQSLIKCPTCDEPLLKLDDGCGVCGWSDAGKVEFDDIESDRPISHLKQSKQTGSLYQYTANRRGKDGIIREYPIVEGERQRENDEHWYWGLSYIEKNSRGKWCDRSASIPQKSLPIARQLMREKFLYTDTIAICQLKFLWQEERGRYLIGEIKPEACPRLCVVSLEEKDFILAPPNWGEMRADERMALSRKIREAIADNQPLEVIKGLLA